MRSRIIVSVGVAFLAAFALTGCVSENVSENSETVDESVVDASSTIEGSCEIIVDDLTEQVTLLHSGTEDYTPSTRLTFLQGAIVTLTSASEKLGHDGVKDALLKVRDTAGELIPLFEEMTKNPDTWSDGSLDESLAVANENTATALAELGELCPAVTELAP